MNRNLTFEEFSKRLENMNNQCGSCKYLDNKGEQSFCSKHQVQKSNKSPRCEDWRYFA